MRQYIRLIILILSCFYLFSCSRTPPPLGLRIGDFVLGGSFSEGLAVTERNISHLPYTIDKIKKLENEDGVVIASFHYYVPYFTIASRKEHIKLQINIKSFDDVIYEIIADSFADGYNLLEVYESKYGKPMRQESFSDKSKLDNGTKIKASGKRYYWYYPDATIRFILREEHKKEAKGGKWIFSGDTAFVSYELKDTKGVYKKKAENIKNKTEALIDTLKI